jgi:hypothetical protein
MAKSGTEKLLSLLFDEGRELLNFRFFPGEKVSSSDELCDASDEAIRLALAAEEDTIPPISKEPVAFGDLVSKI